jgi:isopenicillin N synthase-like dioxygenase
MARPGVSAALPIIDAGALGRGHEASAAAVVAEQVQAACADGGFFYVTGVRLPITRAGRETVTLRR